MKGMTDAEWRKYWSAFWKKQKSLWKQIEEEKSNGDDTRRESKEESKRLPEC